MAHWSNAAGLYQCSRESYGDTVCLFAAGLCLNFLTRKLRKRCMDTLDFQRLGDAKVLRQYANHIIFYNQQHPLYPVPAVYVQVPHPRLSRIPINPRGFYYQT